MNRQGECVCVCLCVIQQTYIKYWSGQVVWHRKVLSAGLMGKIEGITRLWCSINVRLTLRPNRRSDTVAALHEIKELCLFPSCHTVITSSSHQLLTCNCDWEAVIGKLRCVLHVLYIIRQEIWRPYINQIKPRFNGCGVILALHHIFFHSCH